MRLIQADKNDFLLSELRRIRVDERSLGIFLAKAQNRIVKFTNLSAPQVNILKQTALVCGADLAVPREAYERGDRRRYPALLLANRREIRKIIGQLAGQSWMKPVVEQLSEASLIPPHPRLKIGRECTLFRRTHIMGIINITPDSFYRGSRFATADGIQAAACRMVKEGADYLDLGAESTRPGAKSISARDEIRRLDPILGKLARRINIPVSLDTYKAEVADYALDNGARIINDISGLGWDRRMAKVIARHKATVIIMHTRGRPKNMQKNPHYSDLMETICGYFQERIRRAVDAGIDLERIVIDPGLGFGKRLEDNYEIISRLTEIAALNRPVLIGHSRKSFIGNPFGLPPEERLEGTLAVQSLLIRNGASIIRVHDVQAAKRAALLVDRILR